ALPLYRRTERAARLALGEGRTLHADILTNLALAHLARGDHGAALALQRRAVALCRQSQGERHPQYGACLHHLASMYLKLGRPAAALRLQEQALSIARRQLPLDTSVLSERQQLAAQDALRGRLDLRLAMPDEAAHFSHDHVLSWKGSVFAAQ